MQLDAVLYWFLVHSSVANLCILTWDRYAAILHPLRYNTFIILTPWKDHLVGTADSIVDMIIAVPGFGNVRCKLRHCFKSAASNWCLRF